MKKILLATATAFLMMGASAQKGIEVQETSENFSTGSVNSLTVFIPGGNVKDVTKAWEKQLKDIKGKVKSKDEIFADDCRIKKMSDNTFDVYSKVVESEGGVTVIAAFDLGGAYASSKEHGEQFPFIREVMYEFGVQETKAAIGAVIKVEEKKLEELQKEKEETEKENEDHAKDIEDYKKKIAEAEKAIEENKGLIEEKSGEIKAQEKVVEEAKQKQKAVK
jgi:peptidoglycan hydrolase CwlO-like protein